MKLPETPAWKLKSHGITDQAYYERTLPTPAGGVEINIHLLLDLAKSILKQPHRVTTAMIQRNTLHPSPKICSYLLSRIQVSAKASRSIHESVTFERQPLNTQHDSLSYPREKKKKMNKVTCSIHQSCKITILFSYKNTCWPNHRFFCDAKIKSFNHYVSLLFSICKTGTLAFIPPSML